MVLKTSKVINMNIKKIFGNNLKNLRVSSGLTLELLAEKLELSYQVLSKIEKGQQFITAENFEKICKLFKVEPSQLLVSNKHSVTKIKTIERITTLLKTMDEEHQDIIHKLLITYVKTSLNK